MNRFILPLLVLCLSIPLIGGVKVAQTPPMGWNSFDAYDCRINEAEFKANVDVMAERLKEFGYEYAVIDYIWWHPEPGNWDTPRRFGHPNIRFNEDGSPLHPEYTTMDEYGRLLPAVERFPSSAGGKGFKPIADYVHSKGLKFGIHIMRGVHRVAYHEDTPIKGTEYSARDIGETWDTCNWCNHMFGVDASKPGAQEYYDSLFELYASWGVDFVKVDDIAARDYKDRELELIRNAIDNCGRPMVLSLSPGETPIYQAEHVIEHANMWRISSDLWDEWPQIRHMFYLLDMWSNYAGPGHWPDADMIPFGRLSLNGRPHGPERLTKLTETEQHTVMSLWSIVRSPLMIGADLLSSPDFTFEVLTNSEVLEVNQTASDSRRVYQDHFRTLAVWLADAPDPNEKFFALFNFAEEPQEVSFDFEIEHLRGKYKIRDLWSGEDLGVFEKEFMKELPSHGSGLYKMTLVE